MDVDNFPETVDYNGPIGNTFIRQPVLRYTYGTQTSGNFTVALENSSAYVLDGRATGAARAPGTAWPPPQPLPPARPGPPLGQGLRLGQHERPRRDPGAPLRRRGRAPTPRPAAGAPATSGLVKTVGQRLGAWWRVTYGDGIGRYMNYIEGAVYDPAADEIRMERAIGVVAGYQWKARADLRFNFVYGMTRELRQRLHRRPSAAAGLDRRPLRREPDGPVRPRSASSSRPSSRSTWAWRGSGATGRPWPARRARTSASTSRPSTTSISRRAR